MPWALEAVLQEVEAEAVDLLIFGGDLIGGPSPAQTLALARRDDALFVRGNGEREPDEWDRHNLDPGDLRWLEELPISVSIDGVLYCHSTPNDDLPLITAATPAEAVAELFAGMEENTAVIGHTHHQFD